MKTEEEILQYIEDLAAKEDNFSYSQDCGECTEDVYDRENTEDTLVRFANWLLGTEYSSATLPYKMEKYRKEQQRKKDYEDYIARNGFPPPVNITGMDSIMHWTTCPSSCTDTQLIPNPDLPTPPNKEI